MTDQFDDDLGEPAGEPSEQLAPVVVRKKKNPLTEWLIVVVVAIAAAFLVRAFVVQQFAVSGHSMDTTLHDTDRVLVNKLSYRLHDPNRGDVVVLEQNPNGPGERDLIKRVIALPGETFEYRDCVTYINGRKLDEPYLDSTIVTAGNCGASYPATLIASGKVFVMGDNRPGSGDSRAFGAIDEKLIVGRAFVVIWPLSHWEWL